MKTNAQITHQADAITPKTANVVRVVTRGQLQPRQGVQLIGLKDTQVSSVSCAMMLRAVSTALPGTLRRKLMP